MKKLKLYHQIGKDGEDSAAVRDFLVKNDLVELVEMFNIKYEDSRMAVAEVTGGSVEAPVLVTPERVLRGRELILDWLRTNILAQRE